MRRATVSALAALAVLAVLMPAAPAQAEREIRMSGSGTAKALLADLAYFYRHSVDRPPRFSLVSGGSAIGIADVARGIVDVGMVSRDLAATDPKGLVVTPFALSGICLVTNRANPVADLSRAQIQDILAGRVTSWAQVPGSTRTDAIVPVVTASGTGARTVFDEVFVDAATQIAYRPSTFGLGWQVRDFVERTPGAWGYVDLVLSRSLHPVRYEGIACTRETIRSRTYPGRTPFGLVTRGRPRGEVARFARWITTSPTARRVIRSRYVMP